MQEVGKRQERLKCPREEPGVAGASPSVAGGAAGVQSRASATTSRIFSNHQWARLERLRACRDARVPVRFSKPICSWRFMIRHLPPGRATMRSCGTLISYRRIAQNSGQASGPKLVCPS